jgi:pimeloyl-ACP methyl ester carboxylesterase
MPVEELNGTRIRYEVAGSGDVTLVMVHGSWTSHHGWDLVTPGLAGSFRVVTYDRRGHSESPAPPGQGSIHDDVDDLAALIEHFADPPVFVAGSSFGSIITLRLAAKRPELLRGIIVHEPPLFSIIEGDPEQMALVAENQRLLDAVIERIDSGDHASAAQLFVETVAIGPGMWDVLPDPVKRTFIENAPTFADECNDPDQFTMDLEGIRAFAEPVLVTRGDSSFPFFPAVISALLREMPGAETVVFEGAGHIPHTTHPDAYVSSVAAFIERHAR